MIINFEMKKFFVFTNAIDTEGRVDVIWNAVPGFPNAFGKAGVHGLPVFVIPVAAAAARYKELTHDHQLWVASHTYTHDTHTYTHPNKAVNQSIIQHCKFQHGATVRTTADILDYNKH